MMVRKTKTALAFGLWGALLLTACGDDAGRTVIVVDGSDMGGAGEGDDGYPGSDDEDGCLVFRGCDEPDLPPFNEEFEGLEDNSVPWAYLLIGVTGARQHRGEYEWNARGGVVHWTDRDPSGRGPGGWLEHQGRRYQ